MLAAWQAYIDMEVRLGHVKEARSIYRRCYTRKFDGTGSEVCALYSFLFYVLLLLLFCYEIGIFGSDNTFFGFICT